MVIFKDSFPSADFSRTTSLTGTLSFTLFGRGSPIMTFFPFAPSACVGRSSTFGLFSSRVWTLVCIGKGVLSTCISESTNHLSLMADCTWRRKTLQSLVACEKELCHLQYAWRFNSSADGIAWDNLMFPFLSNSSKIWSHLETSKVNFTSFCRFFWVGFNEGQEEGLAFDGQTNSAAKTSFPSLSEQSESWSTTCVLDR